MSGPELLERIIRKTDPDPGKKVIKVSDASHLMSLANVSFSKKETKTSSPLNRERLKIFNEILDDIKFFFSQYRQQTLSNKDPGKILPLKKRLEILVDIVNEEIDDFKDTLYQNLKSDDPDVGMASVFIFSSVKSNSGELKYLKSVLSGLTDSEACKRVQTVEGLKHGFHPGIYDRLLRLSKTENSQTRQLCLEILAYRESNK